MSQHQHRKLERGRKSAHAGKQPFMQPLDKKKSEQSAVASYWVRQKLYCHINDRRQRKSEGQDPHQQGPSNIPDFEENNLLRRTVSEPILKLRAKRSGTQRQNPLQLKSSATPAVRAPDPMAASPSSASVPKGSSSPETKMSQQEPQTYNTSLAHKDDSPLHVGVQSTILCPPYPATAVHPQVLTYHPTHLITVPGQWTMMSHRPVSKSLSAPPYIQQCTHIHTQTYMLTNPIFQQHWPYGIFQQQALSKKVPVCVGLPVSPAALGWDRDKAREEMLASSQLLTDNSGTNRLAVPHGEYKDWQHKIFHRNLTRVHSTPDAIDRCPSSRLSSLLARNFIRSQPSYTTGLVCDSQMLKYEYDCGDKSFDPEHAGRIRSIWLRLQECGLVNQCELVKGRLATFEELLSVHSEDYVKHNMDLDRTWNISCRTSALRKAVGSVIELALRVARGDLRNGFALVTPSGHHAARSPKNASIFFNYVAIAAKQLQEQLKVKKILIVDWDIHHGSGTEAIFYTDPNVLYISLHRYDGSRFHCTGEPNKVGSDRGKGYNVNVAWSGGLSPPIGDAEYLAAFRTVVMPIAHEFSPNMVLVSAGFDAAKSHSADLTGYTVSAKCFGFLTRKLMELAEGRVVLVLEGGYDLRSLCDASQACVSALMGNEPEPLSEKEVQRSPCASAVSSLETVLRVQSSYWRSVRALLDTVSLSYRKAESRRSAGSEAALVVGRLTMTASNPSQQVPNVPTEDDENDQMKMISK